MDKRVHECPGLTEEDIDHLQEVAAGLPLTADVSRADILLCCRLREGEALVLDHAVPQSTTSLYRSDVTGRILHPKEQPLLFRVLKSGSSARGQKEILSSGAPVIQDAYPITCDDRKVIGALIFETNMIAYERHRRRKRSFRHAVRWLQEMCLSGDLAYTRDLARFGPYDGVYLVDQERIVTYMNGIAANLFRSVGVVTDIREQNVSELEALDGEIIEKVFRTHKPLEMRRESEDGRIWVRTAIPLRVPPATWQNYWQNLPWYGGSSDQQDEDGDIDAVLVMIHNATEAVQKQRELNVKSAIIQEVHHRVKNNLQTIAAILRIQARRCSSDEAKQQLTDAVNRVLSMSVIHEFLSQDEHRPINVREVCQRIANQVAQVATNPEQSIEFSVSGPNIRLPAGMATPTAMVVNELLLNALEHGIQERQFGAIHVYLTDLGNAVQIEVEDDGGGLPDDFDASTSESLGLQIVHTLVTDDLKGQLRLESILPGQERPESDETEGGDSDKAPARNGMVSDSSVALGADGKEDSGRPPVAASADEDETPTPVRPVGTRAVVIFPKRSFHGT